MGRDQRRVRVLDEPARHHLSALARYSGKLGHRGQRAGHGVRQHGQDLGNGRRLHAQSIDRREEALRRVPDQCPGRRRGRRHPHPAGDHRTRAQGGRLRQAVDGKGDAGGVQRADPHLRRARAPLPRHAGPRIHRRTGQAVDAADTLGQAHGECRAQDRGRARQRRSDHPQGGGHPHRSGRARPAPASHHRSQCRAQDHRHRASGFARRRVRRDRVLLRRGRGAQGQGQEGYPRPGRDLARGHPRHARGRGHSHHPRRHDLARRRGGARHGQALRFRRRRAARRLRRRHHEHCRAHVQGGRYHHHRRLDRAGAGGARADDGASAVRRVRHADGLGRRGAHARRARQCRYPERRPRRAQVRRRGHRALPHRAHVLRGGPHPRRARDDPRRRREVAPRRARQAAAHAARISSSCSRSCRGCR